MKKCIYGHILDFKICFDRNALIKDNLEKKSFNFMVSKILVNIQNKQHKKTVEICIIFNCNAIKQRHI